MTNSLAVETRGLAKHYGESVAVAGLDLAVPHGCAFGLLGPNGAGKSTTIRMLLGLVPPTSGQATVLGRPVDKDAHAIRAEVADGLSPLQFASAFSSGACVIALLLHFAGSVILLRPTSVARG